MVAVVIDIPATKSDPHQVSDGKYYRRHNFNKLTMEYYEVRDYFRRSVAPDLCVDFFFDQQATTFTLLYGRNDEQIPTGITPLVSNLSNQPALYAAVTLCVNGRLQIADTAHHVENDSVFQVIRQPLSARVWQIGNNMKRKSRDHGECDIHDRAGGRRSNGRKSSRASGGSSGSNSKAHTLETGT